MPLLKMQGTVSGFRYLPAGTLTPNPVADQRLNTSNKRRKLPVESRLGLITLAKKDSSQIYQVLITEIRANNTIHRFNVERLIKEN